MSFHCLLLAVRVGAGIIAPCVALAQNIATDAWRACQASDPQKRIVTNDGLVLTNRHVIDKCSAVTIHDRGPAVVKEVDDTNDLALLKMQGGTVAAIFRSTSPGLGDAVYALGFPYSGVLGPGINFTRGMI